MRTTITLEDDVASRLVREVRASGKSFKTVVNEALREALTRRRGKPQLAPFTVAARPLGLVPGLDYADVGTLLEVAEGRDHR